MKNFLLKDMIIITIQYLSIMAIIGILFFLLITFLEKIIQ